MPSTLNTVPPTPMTSSRPDASMFKGAKYIRISESSVTQVVGVDVSEGESFKALREATAPAAFHNSGERFDPPKCHPRTRKAILAKIMSWIRGEIDVDAFTFWLNGSVGIGKSAIAQTIAEMCAEEALLLASFFFSRSDSTRNNAKRLITTLACQIAIAIPAARRCIVQAFSEDPLITTRSLETQLTKLIIEPLQAATSEQISIPPLIIIDGLDECIEGTMQRRVLDIVNRAVTGTSSRLIFLVVSRPEPEISLAFEVDAIGTISTQYNLNSATDGDKDILCFLNESFDEIKRTHPLKASIPSLWPTDDEIRQLIERTSGQFLYAKLVINYTSSIRHLPHDRLVAVLRIHASKDNPFMELDALYHLIFSKIDNVGSALRVLGLMITWQMTVFSRLRNIRGPFLRNPLSGIVRDMGFDDVKLLFGDLASVLTVKRHSGMWDVELQHASIQEFLLDRRRSEQFYINIRLNHARWIFWYVRNRFNDDWDAELCMWHFRSLCRGKVGPY